MAKRTGATMADAAKHKARSEERKTDVSNHLGRLKGRSNANIMGDDVRGPSSPLGQRKKPTEVGRGR
jgi:hypothetical protein